jgi:hypothetical protein
MTAKRPSPLVGHNTGVTYRGVPYHVQTEDSGVDHPHVITHLFAEGGHIVATRKTSYAEHVGTPAYPEAVKQLIRSQHKQMLIALRDGCYDGLIAECSAPPPPPPEPVPPPMVDVPIEPAAPPPRRRSRPSLAGTETSRDSLDEIIIADLVLLLDE